METRSQAHAAQYRGDAGEQADVPLVPAVDHQQRRFVDEHEGYDEAGGTHAHGGPPGRPLVGFGQCCRCEHGQRHRWRDGGEDGEVEGEHVRGRQRCAEFDQCRHHQRDSDDVGRRGRQTQSEDQTGQRGQHQCEHQAVVRHLDHDLGEGDAHAGDGDGADDDAGGGAGDCDRQRVLGAFDQRFRHLAPVDFIARAFAQHRRGQAQDSGDQRAQRRGIAQQQAAEDDRNRQKQVAALAHDLFESRQFVFGHAVQAVTPRLEVHGKKHRDVKEDRGNQRPKCYLRVGHGEKLGHHERPCAHHRRHDLAAGGGGGFDCRGKRGLEPRAFHQRDSHRAVDHDVGDRAAGHRAEQAGGDHRNLAGAAGGVAGNRQRKIHEQFAGTAFFHERAEDHEQHHVRGRHAQCRAEDAFGGQVQLLQQHGDFDVGEKQRVGEEGDRRHHQSPAEHAARGFEHDENGNPGKDRVEPRQVIDVDDAIGHRVVSDENVQDECPRAEEHDAVQRAPSPVSARFQRVEQEDQGQCEQQVVTTKNHRFGRAEAGDIHVVQRHRDGHY